MRLRCERPQQWFADDGERIARHDPRGEQGHENQRKQQHQSGTAFKVETPPDRHRPILTRGSSLP
jgi:hypothetical protein